MMKLARHQTKAFTLLEVVLALTIMSTMAVITTQAISRALRARTKIQAEVDDVSALRDSIRIIKSDLNLAFHHRDFENEILQAAAKPKATASITPGVSTNPNAPPNQNPNASGIQLPPRKTKREDPATHFVGSDTEVNFITLNSGRLSTAVKQADFIEVGYSLKSCSNLTTGKASQCLYRRVQNIIDSDVKAGGNETVMIENITEFKLRYIAETKQDWVSNWDSRNSTNDAGTRGRFPESVEVSLGLQREFEGKTRTYSMQVVVPIHFPNNPVGSSSAGSATNGTAPAQPGGVIDQ